MNRYQVVNARVVSKQRRSIYEATQHYAQTGEWTGWGEPSAGAQKLRREVLARKENERERE